MRQSRASRRRYQQYRAKLRERAKGQVSSDDLRRDPALERSRRPRSRSFLQIFAAFLGFLRPHYAMVLGNLAALTAATLLALVPLYIPKLVFDNVLADHPLPPWLAAVGIPLPSQPRELLVVLAIAGIVLTCLATAFGLWGRWHNTRIAKRLQVEVRKQVFEHAARLPLHRVYELKSGGLASILRDDAGSVGELTFSMLYNPWRAICQLIGTLIILAFVDIRLLLGGLAILPIVWLTHRTWIARIRPLFRDIRFSRRYVDAHATEAFGGMRVVRGFGRQQGEATAFVQNNNMMIRQELFAWWWMRGVDTAWAILIPAASAIMLWYGGTRILDDRAAVAAGTLAASEALTPGDLVMFLSYLAAMLGPIAALAETANGLQNSLAGLDRILDLMQEPREMESPPDAVHVAPATVRGAISLRDVSYVYPNTQDHALRDVSLEVAPGQVVALVGSSGAGKTTLCNLVARFYDPTGGSIHLDGVDLRQIDVESYRRCLGVVEQDIFLFDGSVADNIRYARRGASECEIRKAAKLANAHEFIVDLPEGYDTWVGERGVKLSGGQRQRLAIARAILADPRILILDEATSNLDTESERLIQASLRTLMRDRTSFVIAHRLSTIRDADQIVVLERGRVIETGTHEALMARSGRYQQMVLLQTMPIDEAAEARKRALSGAGAGEHER